MHVLYCALDIGSSMMVIGCMVVPFHIIHIVDVLSLYDQMCYA
jgi:hypothetical protein